MVLKVLRLSVGRVDIVGRLVAAAATAAAEQTANGEASRAAHVLERQAGRVRLDVLLARRRARGRGATLLWHAHGQVAQVASDGHERVRFCHVVAVVVVVGRRG